MHLLSCENPKRVFNKYTGEYVWVTCGECNSCKNRRAKFWTDACERERSVSDYALFVTLTYNNESLPVYNYTGGFDSDESKYIGASLCLDNWLRSSRERDTDCLQINRDLFETDADKELFYSLLDGNGIPYASKTDIQLFNKRLNKYFKDNVTNKYKNFRYFIVSELGSTTLRPHFHGIFFVNDSNVAAKFSEAVFSCWKYGRVDVQFIEKSACSYVAQYVNKLFDLPSFYKARPIRPFYLASRNPLIGNINKYSQSDEEIFDKCLVQAFSRGKKNTQPVLSELDTSTENRLFPKCPLYGQVSYFVRTQLYTASRRFCGEESSFKGFCEQVRKFLEFDLHTDFYEIMCAKVDDFSEQGINWLRRLYYLSRKVMKMTLRFGVSIFAYLQKIDEYWNKKQLYILHKFYDFQVSFVQQNYNDVHDLCLMYPAFVFNNYGSIGLYLSEYNLPCDVVNQRRSAARFAYSNKRTHYKNMYLDSLKDKNHYLFNILKKFYHAKKCDEINQAFAS